MLNNKFLWPRWDIIYRDLARVTEGMSFWNRFFVKTWFGWAFAFLGLVGMFSLIILSFFYFYSYFYEFSLFEMKRSFFMDQFVCTVVFLEQFIKYIYIYLLEIIRDYFIVLDFWYFMGQILSRVIFIYQIYFDVIFLFLSTEWYVSFISLPYDNFLELYYYLSQWKDYDMNILRIVNEMDSYAFSQFSYIALEYITFYYQNHWDAHRYVSRGYTYQDYLNYKSMEILDIRNKYVSYLDVLEDWAIADPENEMFRRLKAVTYQFDIQLRQRAWLFEFDEAFKELRDLFKDPELIALVKEVSPEAANFLLLLGDEIWRISSYLRWPLFRWLLYQNDLLERFRTEEGKFLARDKRLLMWFLEFFEYVDYLYSKRYKFAWIELIRMTQLEYWQKWDYSELIWRYMMFLSKQDEMWKDRFNFLLLLNDNPITGEDFVSNKWYKKLNKSLVDARNSTTYFAFYNPNVALIFYRISTLVNDLYTKTVEAKTAIDKDRSLNWLIRGITYPDVPLRFLVKYSDFNINLFSSVFDFYLLCFFKLFRNFIFYNIYDFLKFVYFNVIDEISIFIEIFRESYPTHNLIDFFWNCDVSWFNFISAFVLYDILEKFNLESFFFRWLSSVCIPLNISIFFLDFNDLYTFENYKLMVTDFVNYYALDGVVDPDGFLKKKYFYVDTFNNSLFDNGNNYFELSYNAYLVKFLTELLSWSLSDMYNVNVLSRSFSDTAIERKSFFLVNIFDEKDTIREKLLIYWNQFDWSLPFYLPIINELIADDEMYYYFSFWFYTHGLSFFMSFDFYDNIYLFVYYKYLVFFKNLVSKVDNFFINKKIIDLNGFLHNLFSNFFNILDYKLFFERKIWDENAYNMKFGGKISYSPEFFGRNFREVFLFGSEFLSSLLLKVVFVQYHFRHVHYNLMEFYGLPKRDFDFRFNRFNSIRRLRTLRTMVYQMNKLWFPEAFYLHGHFYWYRFKPIFEMRYDVLPYYIMPFNAFWDKSIFWKFGMNFVESIMNLRSFYVFPRYNMEMLGDSIGGFVSAESFRDKWVGPWDGRFSNDHTIYTNVSYSNRAKIAFRLLHGTGFHKKSLSDNFYAYRNEDLLENVSSRMLSHGVKKRDGKKPEWLADMAFRQAYIDSFFGKKKVFDVSNVANIIQYSDYKDDIKDRLIYNYKLRKLYSLFFGRSLNRDNNVISDIENNVSLYKNKFKEGSISFSLKKDLGELNSKLTESKPGTEPESEFEDRSFGSKLKSRLGIGSLLRPESTHKSNNNNNEDKEEFYSLGRSNVMMSDFDSVEYRQEVDMVRKYLYKKYFGDDIFLRRINVEADKYMRDYVHDDNRFFVKHKAAGNYIYKVRLRDYYPYGVRTLREFLIFVFCIPSLILFSFVVQWRWLFQYYFVSNWDTYIYGSYFPFFDAWNKTVIEDYYLWGLDVYSETTYVHAYTRYIVFLRWIPYLLILYLILRCIDPILGFTYMSGFGNLLFIEDYILTKLFGTYTSNVYWWQRDLGIESSFMDNMDMYVSYNTWFFYGKQVIYWVFIAFIVLFFYTNIVIVFFVLRRRFWYLLERYLLNRFFPLGFFLIPSIWVLLGSIVSFGRSKFVNMFGDPLFFYTRNNWSLDLNFNFYRKYMLDNKLLYLSYSLGSYKLVLYRNNDWRLYKTSYWWPQYENLDLNKLILNCVGALDLENKPGLFFGNSNLYSVKFVEDVCLRHVALNEDLLFLQQIYRMMFLDVMYSQVLNRKDVKLNVSLLSEWFKQLNFMRLNGFVSSAEFVNAKFSYWVLSSDQIYFDFSSLDSIRKIERGFGFMNSFYGYNNMNDYVKLSMGFLNSGMSVMDDKEVDWF